jgi:Uma2 family endonuclease
MNFPVLEALEGVSECTRASRRGEPAWDVALLFPRQGEWTEEDYLALDTNQLIELSDGCLEVLPVPTIFHQLIAQFLFKLLDAYVTSRALGIVLMAPVPVRLGTGKLREPDVVFLSPQRVTNRHRPPQGADLVMEVVSAGARNRARDLEVKRKEYAKAGISEYWIVDPETQRVTVLTLQGKKYRVHGTFAPGDKATSDLIPGFAVDVTSTFASGEADTAGDEPPPKKKPKKSGRKPKTGQ